MTIEGGYFIIARKVAESAIANSPPHFREVWFWLLKEANHCDKKVGGRTIKRGQCFRSYNDIIDGLSWRVGYRKECYKKHHIEKAMKWLTKERMVETTKATRGMLITILNYDKYQDPKNYESDNGSDKRATMERQDKQEGKELKKKEVKIKGNGFYPEWLDKELWKEFKKMRVAIKKPLTEFAEKKSITKLKTIIDKGFSQEDVVSIAIEKCWQTFYEPHEKLMQKDDESAFDKELSAIRKQRELANEKKTALSK